MKLTPAQIEQYAYAAGFRGSALRTAVAVALAESGGETTAYNPELASSYSRPGAGSRGLWQIFGAVHPAYNSDAALDPAVNARGAYEIYRQAGNSFTPWSAFTQGTYKRFLSAVPSGGIQSQQGAPKFSSLGASSPSAAPRSATIGATSGAAGGVQGGFLQSITPSIELKLPEVDWLSLGFIVGGLALIMIGLVILGVAFTKEAAPELVGAAVKAAI